MITDIDTRTGSFTLIARDGINHFTYPTFMRKNLWFHYLFKPSSNSSDINPQTSIICTLYYGATFDLWHHRLGHPGTKIIEQFSDHTIGVPKLKPHKFYNCALCSRCKFHSRHIPALSQSKSIINTIYEIMPMNEIATTIGQHLHMDFGFVRGSDWSMKTNDGKLVTSVDKYRAYLLVVDSYSRYIWIFLTRDKTPPLDQVQ